MSQAALLVLAMIGDALLGEPRWLWTRLPHPAVLMGRAVAALDVGLNRGARRRLKGAVAVALLLSGALGLGAVLAALPGGAVIEAILAAVLLAQRSLAEHVAEVARALRRSLPEARRAVGRIVGRDTADMDEPAIARAAIESAAENLSDGVIAPAFWFLLLGLPGMLACKAINTADSMIGYRTPRYEAFGWAAARLDDVLNWVPARLTAALILLAHGRPGALVRLHHDARLHRSPNAGWPEAAIAVCLGVALAGPRSYGGERRDFPFVNPRGRHGLTAEDVTRATRALWRTWALALLLSALLAFA